MPNESWNLLEHMMQKRSYMVSTSTAQMQVVGRRHYGLKALPFGGGGGRQITRELFDTLLLWKGRLVLDEKGEAHVEATLNDALTSFTAVAVATGGPGSLRHRPCPYSVHPGPHDPIGALRCGEGGRQVQGSLYLTEYHGP